MTARSHQRRVASVLARARRAILAGIVVLGVATLAPSGTHAQEPAATEYQLKAVFLFNFAQFVTWPPTALADPTTPLQIGVLGNDPFGSALDATVRGEHLAGRPLMVRHFTDVADVDSCEILFVSRSEAGHLDAILLAMAGKPVLLVSDIDRFAAHGGMIGFVTSHDRVRLQINLKAAQDAGLAVSSKLLRLADLVGPGGR